MTARTWHGSPPKLMKIDQQNCHPDRSEAQWRDLLFYSAVSEMFFDKAQPNLTLISIPFRWQEVDRDKTQRACSVWEQARCFV
jgi:hypothetical protein